MDDKDFKAYLNIKKYVYAKIGILEKKKIYF